VYHTNGSEIWYIHNLIPENLHLEGKFLDFAVKEGLTQGFIGSRKINIFFVYIGLSFVTENKIIFKIGYHFRPLFYVVKIT